MLNVASLIRSLERVARYQQQVILNLQRLLPTINTAQKQNAVKKRYAPKMRRLRCPRCSRRFALPMNLGRHLQASHRRKSAKRAA